MAVHDLRPRHVPIIFCGYALCYCVLFISRGFLDGSSYKTSPVLKPYCIKIRSYNVCYAKEFDISSISWQILEVLVLSLFMTIYTCCAYVLTCTVLDRTARRGFWDRLLVHMGCRGSSYEEISLETNSHNECRKLFEALRRKMENDHKTLKTVMRMVIDNEEEIMKLRENLQHVKKELGEFKDKFKSTSQTSELATVS